MKKHILLLMSVLSITSELAFAGAGTHLTIRNDSNQDAHISSLDSKCWYPNDLKDNIVKAHETKTLYTELVNSGSCNCWINSEWSQQFMISVGERYSYFSLTALNEDIDRGHYFLTFLGRTDVIAGTDDFSPMSGSYKGQITIRETKFASIDYLENAN